MKSFKEESWSWPLRRNSKKWEFMPVYIPKFNRQDPILGMDLFCGQFTLSDTRDRLQDLYLAAMGSSHWKDDAPKDKEEKMYFLNELLLLIETTYYMNKMCLDDRFIYTIRKKDKQDNPKK